MSDKNNKEKKMNIEKINDELNSLVRKRDKLVIELDDISKNILTLLDKKYTLDPSKVRIKCIQCKGTGYIQEGENKRLCPICNGTKFNWAEVYTLTNDDKKK